MAEAEGRTQVGKGMGHMGTQSRVKGAEGGSHAWCVGAYSEGCHTRGVPAQLLVESSGIDKGGLRRVRWRAAQGHAGGQKTESVGEGRPCEAQKGRTCRLVTLEVFQLSSWLKALA